MAERSSIPASLFREIRDAQEDDAPRLVLADWLSDRSDIRGEMITTSCELARLERYADAIHDERYVAIAMRNAELLPDAARKWRASLGLSDECEITLRRGVPAVLKSIRVPDFVRLQSFLAGLPIERIRVAFESTQVEAITHLTRLPCTALELYQIDMGEWLPNSHVEALARWSALRGVNDIAFSFRVTDEDLAMLISSPNLAQLNALAAHCNMDDAALRPLEFPTGLRTLDLRIGQLGPAGCQDLASRASLANLEILRLSINALRDDGLTFLSRAAFAKNLKVLAVASCHLGTRGAQAVASSMPSLRALEMEGCTLDAVTLDQLLRSCIYLEQIGLRRSMLDDRHARVFADVVPECMSALDLSDNLFTARGLAVLARSPRLKNLRDLHVGDLSAAQGEALAMSTLAPAIHLVARSVYGAETRGRLRGWFRRFEESNERLDI